jgi:hypothetical protein
MGVLTTLKGISPTPTQQAAACAIGLDAIGLLAATQSKTSELIISLNNIVALLPNGDPNIATLNGIITSLS